MSVLEKKFIEAFRPLSEELGFVRVGKTNLFIRGASSGGRIGISLGLNPTSEKGIFKVVLFAHIRLGEEEKALEEIQPHPPAGKHPNFLININCDNLWEDPELANQLMLRTTKPESAVADSLKAIRTTVIPFLQKYEDRQTLLANLTQSDPLARITSDVGAVYRLPLARAAMDGRKDDFEKLASSYIHQLDRYLPHLSAEAKEIIGALRERYWPQHS